MECRIYLGEAFGWENKFTAKAAILQLQQNNPGYANDCPGAMLEKNKHYRVYGNLLKIGSYIPVVNIIVGLAYIILGLSANERGIEKEVFTRMIIRGIAVILTGPLLIIADAVKTIFDLVIAKQYMDAHPDLFKQFTAHEHTNSPWAGHPVECYR